MPKDKMFSLMLIIINLAEATGPESRQPQDQYAWSAQPASIAISKIYEKVC